MNPTRDRSKKARRIPGLYTAPKAPPPSDPAPPPPPVLILPAWQATPNHMKLARRPPADDTCPCYLCNTRRAEAARKKVSLC